MIAIEIVAIYNHLSMGLVRKPALCVIGMNLDPTLKTWEPISKVVLSMSPACGRKPEPPFEEPTDPCRDLNFCLHGKAGFLFRMILWFAAVIRNTIRTTAAPVIEVFFSGETLRIDIPPSHLTLASIAVASGSGLATGRSQGVPPRAAPARRYISLIPAPGL